MIFPVIGYGQFSGNTTPTYDELIQIYKQWDADHEEIECYVAGNSDTDKPLYICFINGAGDSTATYLQAKQRTVVLVNNAIHPGEPDGVNACLLWVQNWLADGKITQELPLIAIVPAYNVGGMLNRSGTSRANQNGPDEYGFRGNAQNLDLNRDLIKMDAPNSWTLIRLFSELEPDVFVDTHVSNGADYQYTLTLIHSMRERMDAGLSQLMDASYFPEMNKFLKKKQWDWAPYVETKAEIPDSGLVAFNDLPRYAQGYGTLRHTLTVTVETHMLKAFPDRVRATLDYLTFLIDWTGKHAAELESVRSKAIAKAKENDYYKFNYTLTESWDPFEFKGFQAVYIPSEVTGLNRLFYDRSKPWKRKIPNYCYHEAQDSVRIPRAYLVSREAKGVIDRLKHNGVVYEELQRDTLVLTSLRVTHFENGNKPYEGHYLHRNIRIKEQVDSIALPAGSVLIRTDQDLRNFIVSVLEPATEDSYFAWNFMDGYLQQKEYFSPYVFEDYAADLLRKNPQLKSEFEAKRIADDNFAKDAWQQLFFIYQRSPLFEELTFMRLPVYKMY